MNKKTQKALIIDLYGGKVHLREIPIPELKEGEVLIKLDATTINPSDRLSMQGACFERPQPCICGIEGTGRVIDAKGETQQLWIGTRVSFISPAYGSWAEYSVSTPHQIFQIEQDLSLANASCGVINPLTIMGLIQKYRVSKCKNGIINTAASSSLGKMLSKACKIQGIPLLNIVRREETKQILQKNGAEHILVTKQGWQKQYKEFQEKNQFGCLMDCLGGGPTTEALIACMPRNSLVIIYGALQGKPVVTAPLQLIGGLNIHGFLIFSWWGEIDSNLQQEIRSKLNHSLNNELATCLYYRYMKFQQIQQALNLASKNSSLGKIILLPN